jgi:hypothetical protein
MQLEACRTELNANVQRYLQMSKVPTVRPGRSEARFMCPKRFDFKNVESVIIGQWGKPFTPSTPFLMMTRSGVSNGLAEFDTTRAFQANP